LPAADCRIGGLNTTPLRGLVGIGGFSISLVDLETVTTRWWPGRAGWGSTLGLPAIWALVVLIAHAGRFSEAWKALLAAAPACWPSRSAFHDARPRAAYRARTGLLLLVVAASVAGRSTARWVGAQSVGGSAAVGGADRAAAWCCIWQRQPAG
jgi:hypothetical protein